MPTLTQWSGFKNLKNITFIHKPDQSKNDTFIVPAPCIFSAFCNFNFQLVQVVPHFLVLKVSRNLSKFLKAEKVQSVPNQTCAVFDSFLETLHVWFKYFFDFYRKILSKQDVKISSNLSKLWTLK